MVDVLVERLEHPVGNVVLRADRVHLRPGRRYGLVGSNGSGKSTFLKILALLVRPAAGRLTFDGGTPDRSAVTLALQIPYVFRGSVLHNAAFGVLARGHRRIEAARRARAALTMVGLSGFERRHARRLSAGEAQRLNLARALALRTPLLLLDEPFASLDEGGAEAARAALRSDEGHRPTIVIAALSEQDDGFDEVLTIDNGRIRQEG